MRKVLFLFAFLVVLPSSAVCGAIDDLSTYAVLLGRGTACNVDVSGPSRQVGAWIDRTWSGKEKSAMLVAFMHGMESAAKLQASGSSPDSCAKVRGAISSTPWP